MVKCLIIWGMCSVLPLYGQIERPMGVCAMGMGGTTALQSDVWAVKYNPALLPLLKSNQAGTGYINRFVNSALGHHHMALALKQNKSGFGMDIQYSGPAMMQQVESGLAYGLKLTDGCFIGIRFNYYFLRFGDIYGQRHHLSASIGSCLKVSQQIKLVAVVRQIGGQKESPIVTISQPLVYAFGISGQLNVATRCLLMLEKTAGRPYRLKGGIEASTYHKLIRFRTGILTRPFESTFGMGITVKKMMFDLAASWHGQLGLSPGFSLIYSFK